MSDIFCSFVIPTVGRASLTRAVHSVLTQEFSQEQFEIIVVNDSGRELPEEPWSRSGNVTILNTNRVERCFARNCGAAVAHGRYLAFLDDDDWILPGALGQFWELSRRTKAGMYYGGYRFVNSSGKTINEYLPDEKGDCFIRFMSGEWQPLQASLIDTNAFHAIGGFLPLDALRGGDEDVDLTRRISLTHDIAGTRSLVAVIQLDRNTSTTNYSNLQEQSRQSRDGLLDMPGSFSRLHHSADNRSGNTAYWHGRLVWIYLGSIVWNLQQGSLSKALSRLAYLTLCTAISFQYFPSTKFWQGAARPHHAAGWLSTM
jgi:glycosyltransferase involved in cell wall biosynthesis